MAITQQEALDCFASDDLIGIGMEADAVRRALHPEEVVTYAVPRGITLGQPREDVLSGVEECARAGDTTVCLTCSAVPNLTEIEETLAAVRQRFPSLRVQAFSTREIVALAESSGLDLRQVLSGLRAAGLDAISGDDLCAVSVELSTATGLLGLEPWIEVHRLAHHAGLTSTAGLVFGLGESAEDRVRHLFALRELQAETAGFTAFDLIRPKPGAHLDPHLEPTTAVEYLRTLAVARIALDNIPSIEANSLSEGLKVTQMALRFGANDAGAIGTSAKAAFTEEDLRRVIRDAGFTPVERDPLYCALFLNN